MPWIGELMSDLDAVSKSRYAKSAFPGHVTKSVEEYLPCPEKHLGTMN
jgi:hypothetical protein